MSSTGPGERHRRDKGCTRSTHGSERSLRQIVRCNDGSVVMIQMRTFQRSDQSYGTG